MTDDSASKKTYKQLVDFGLDKHGFYGLIYSSDNGANYKLLVGTQGRIFYPEDARNFWPYLKGFVSEQLASAISLDWNNIKNKPDVALKTDIPSLTDYAKKSDLPKLDDYAKKTDIPQAPDLSVYAKKSDIPSLDGYAKMSDLPSVTGLVKQTDLVGYAKLSDIPKPPDLTPYAKTSEVDEVKATADSALSNAEKAQSTAEANSRALTAKVDRSELPVVPTDLVHTAEMEQVRADITKAAQTASEAVTLAKSASVTIDTSNIHQIKKPSEYSEGFSYEVKALSDLGIDLTKYDTSVQNGWIGLVKSIQVSMFSTVYVTQTVRVLGSYRPTTFIRNGSGDSWYPFELVTTW